DRWVSGARRIEQEFGRLSGLDGQPCRILERPAVEPLIRSMVSDDEGRLWVESTTTQGTTLTGIGPGGELLGEAFMPARDMRVAPYRRGDRLCPPTVDERDVEWGEVVDSVWDRSGGRGGIQPKPRDGRSLIARSEKERRRFTST